MRRSFQTIFATMLACLLSACAHDVAKQSVSPTSAPPTTVRTSAADETISAIQTLQNLTPADLQTAKESAREMFERDPVAFRRMRYVLAMFVSPPTPADDDRLLALVEPMIGSAEFRQTADGIIAAVIQQSATARKKLREEMAQQRLRANTVVAGSASKRDDRDAELRSLRAKVEDLEKQLAAMKSIERSVTRR